MFAFCCFLVGVAFGIGISVGVHLCLNYDPE